MRHTIFTIAVLSALQFSQTLAEYNLHYYPRSLDERAPNAFNIIARDMKRNGAHIEGRDITGLYSKRSGISTSPRLSLEIRSPEEEACEKGFGVCPTSKKCCPIPGRCCDDGTCIQGGQTCCSTGGACNADRKCCGEGCIPTESVCCNTKGEFCGKGELCCSTGYCVQPGGECCKDYGTCRPGYKCVITTEGERGCRESDENGGGGTTISVEPTEAGDKISQATSALYSTTITWFYNVNYHVWIQTASEIVTTSAQQTTSIVTSVYAQDSTAAAKSFSAIAAELASSTPVQTTTEWLGEAPSSTATGSGANADATHFPGGISAAASTTPSISFLSLLLMVLSVLLWA